MYRSGQRVVTQAIQKYLGSSYDVVKTVYDNLTLLLGLQNLADNVDKVEDVADNLDDVTSVADNIVAVTEVNDKVDDFNTKYLGSYASAPTVDGNGDPLVEGATYWNTTLNAMFVYTGSQWVKPTGTGIVDVDTFTGDGSTASFPLDVSPASKTNTSVFIDGVYQEKDTYSVSTNLITFNTAPNDEASIEVIVNEITNFITGTQTETHTLTSGQTVVSLTNSPAFASFHIQGEDVDSQRLDLGTDYTLDLLTNTITLTNSYPENTVLKMLYGYDDDISVELAPLNQAILDHVNATENAHPVSAISLSNGKSLQQEGIPVWDTDTVYPVDGLAKGTDGNIYKALVEQSGNDPFTDDGTNWIDLSIISNSKDSNLVFSSVSDLKSGNTVGGSKCNFSLLSANKSIVRTVSYLDGWAATNTPPKGAAFYAIVTATDYGATPDGLGDFYVGGGTDYVAVLTPAFAPDLYQFGAVGDGTTSDQAAVLGSITYAKTFIPARPNNGLILVPQGEFYLGNLSLDVPSSEVTFRGVNTKSSIFIIDNNDTTGFRCNVGSMGLEKLAIVTVSAWTQLKANSVPTKDATGVGLQVAGSPRIRDIYVGGFGNAGVKAVDGTGQLIHGELRNMRIQACGTGLDGTTTGDHTTTKLDTIYITNCDLGFNSRDFTHCDIDNLTIELCAVGAEITGSLLSKLNSWYFEQCTVPYKVLNSGGMIRRQATVIASGAPVETVDETVFGALGYDTEIGARHLRTERLELSYGDPATPNTAREVAVATFEKFPSQNDPRSLKMTNRTTKSGVLEDNATPLMSNGSKATHTASIIYDGVGQSVTVSDSIINGVDYRATGLYRVKFQTSANPIAIMCHPLVDDTARQEINVTTTYEAAQLANARAGNAIANFDIYVTNNAGVAIDEHVAITVICSFPDE